MKTERFHLHSDRYVFDFNHCTIEKGFAQIDTSQDASYFGTWANPFEFKIINYCEGDVSIQTMESEQEFKEEIERIKTWNEEMGFRFIGIDPGFNEALAKRFKDIGLNSMLH